VGVRKFVVEGRVMPDPDPNMTPDEVRQNLASMMPELANAETHQAKDGDDTVYTFERRVGTKG
jgi:PRTRC genetic system protein C